MRLWECLTVLILTTVMMMIIKEVVMVTLVFVAGFWLLFYKDRLFIKTKSLEYASKMYEAWS